MIAGSLYFTHSLHFAIWVSNVFSRTFNNWFEQQMALGKNIRQEWVIGFYIADSIKVAWALGSYCLVVTQVTHCIARNAQMLNAQFPMTYYQSNLFWFSCITKRAVFHSSSIDMWRPFNDSPSIFPGLTQILLMALQSCGPLQILIQTEHLSVACMPGKATLRTVELVSETVLSILREPLWQR